MIVYKVVYKDNYGNLLSAVVHDRSFRLSYRIGEVTSPIPGTPIFAFDSIDEALRFCDNLFDTRILECESDQFSGIMPEIEKHISRFKIPAVDDLEDNMMAFWSKPHKQNNYFLDGYWDGTYTPSGTVLCDWVKPTKIVSINAYLVEKTHGCSV